MNFFQKFFLFTPQRQTEPRGTPPRTGQNMKKAQDLVLRLPNCLNFKPLCGATENRAGALIYAHTRLQALTGHMPPRVIRSYTLISAHK